MKQIGIFEVKTRLSEVCEEVVRTQNAVIVTRRGTPLVRIEPIRGAAPTIRERRAAYVARHGGSEAPAAQDFAPPPRRLDQSLQMGLD